MPDRYPNMPGAYPVETSLEAAEAIAPVAKTLRDKTEAVIREAGPTGLTSDEAAAAVGFDRWSIQPRVSELRTLNRIIDSGQRRRNVTGKRAIVWVVPEFAPAEQSQAA